MKYYHHYTKTGLINLVKDKFGVSSLLSPPEANPKVAKNKNNKVITAPLHLAPANRSGYEVCPMRSKGCTAACLHTAGNPAYMAGKERARVARTKLYFENRELFMALLCKEIDSLVKKHHKNGYEIGLRLNATSDIPWENVKYLGKTLMEHYPKITFYDYTKRHNRKNLPNNYSLTYSLAEDNYERAVKAFENGMNVAVVFRDGLPNKFRLGLHLADVINGDETDYRPDDKKGVVVGLKAKGDAKTDTSGFVQETQEPFMPLKSNLKTNNLKGGKIKVQFTRMEI